MEKILMLIYLLIFHVSRPELVCYFRAGLPYFFFENSGCDSGGGLVVDSCLSLGLV
jgi:hypothetical protein